jgi:hypothetical protein
MSLAAPGTPHFIRIYCLVKHFPWWSFFSTALADNKPQMHVQVVNLNIVRAAILASFLNY